MNKGTIENCYSIGDIGGKASQKGGIFAFSNATVKNCYYTLPEAEALGGTAAAAMQITSPEGLAGKLGNAFKEDTAGANNGYPILVWQAGEAVQPDPRIELTGPDTLWRTANDAAAADDDHRRLQGHGRGHASRLDADGGRGHCHARDAGGRGRGKPVRDRQGDGRRRR
ncbi:MAG: hypothetical protein ACLUNO_13775 [Oscillospiraceae bacterium]